MLARLRSLPERWRWLGLAVQVQKRFGEVHGGFLASAVTLAAFLSLFPLMLLAIAALGFVAAGNVDLPAELIDFLGIPPDSLAAEQLTDALATAEESKAVASIVGLVGLLWTGLGLVAALQYALDAVWQITGRGLKDKLYGLAWLLGAALLFVGSFAITAGLTFLPAIFAPLGVVVGLALSFGLFLWTSKVLCRREVGWRALVPGAVLGAVGLEVLKVLGAIYVPRAVASSSGLYGTLGVVFALLAWLFFFGRLFVYTAMLNVMLWEGHHGTETVEIEVPWVADQPADGGTRAGEIKPAEPPPAERSAGGDPAPAQ